MSSASSSRLRWAVEDGNQGRKLRTKAKAKGELGRRKANEGHSVIRKKGLQAYT